VDIAKAIGGVFHPTTYEPCDSRAMSVDAAVAVSLANSRSVWENCRLLCGIDTEPHPATGTDGRTIYAGVLRIQHRDGATLLYQPALLTEAATKAGSHLLPHPLTLAPVPEVFGSFAEARQQAQDHAGGSALVPPSSTSAREASAPIVLSVRHRDGGTDILLQFGSGTGAGYVNLLVPPDETGYLDFAEAVVSSGPPPLPSRHGAILAPRSLKLHLPPPSPALADLIDRAARTLSTGDPIIMKRDMDLVRALLLDIEANANINGKFVITDADFPGLDANRTAIQYHLRLLMDAGYIEGRDLLSSRQDASLSVGEKALVDTNAPIMVSRMTWDGHEFLDTVRDHKVWQKTKSYLTDIGGVGIDVLKDVAKAVVKDQLRQYTGMNLDA
jgi:hypothetical protein